MDLTVIKKRAEQDWAAFTALERPRILIGSVTCGRAAGAGAVRAAFERELAAQGLSADLWEVGCLGMCYAEPLIEIGLPNGQRVLYGNVTPEMAVELTSSVIGKGELRPDLALAVVSDETAEDIPHFADLPMIAPQERVVLRNAGYIDPCNVNHFIARGGYEGLARALTMTPDHVIADVQKSGLRGRGGAGFPTGKKWEFARAAESDSKYVICNADEGDPGAFMDRSVLESDPHAVLEGLAIAGYAIGANTGYVYVRAEYPLAIERLRAAIGQMKELGFLGDRILGSDFRFDVTIKEGAGAFVCGEETALMASIEGRRGSPRPRPPFPATSGLHGKPTNINNVETLANVSAILAKGADWYAGFGTEKSRGTKTFALAGKINRTGLIEVPMGISLRDIIFEIGGGIPDGKRFKAVQTGGPSGGCLPESLLDLHVDYEELTKAGSIMGSGGMIVMDEDTCIVDIAKYFLEFTHNESCGKCVPCRMGSQHMLRMLRDISAGIATPDHLTALERLAETVAAGSLCALGQTLPNPVLSTLRYFRDEFEQHIVNRSCPARVCKALFQYRIEPEKCKACGKCKTVCPEDAIEGEHKTPHRILQEKCVTCGACYAICPFDAITKV